MQESTSFGVVKHLLQDYRVDLIEEVYQLLILLINCYWFAKQYKQWNHYLAIVLLVGYKIIFT